MTAAFEIEFDESSPEVIRLRDIFKVEGEALEDRMRALAAAAFEEYRVEMSGLRSISTIREQRELRLYLLYRHLAPFGEPTERQIGELFQMTRTQVSTLIAGTWARFRPEMEDRLKDAIQSVLEGAEWLNEQTARVQMPDALAKYVTDILSQTQAPPLEKLREVNQTYDVSRQTVLVLCKRLGIPSEKIAPKKKPGGK